MRKTKRLLYCGTTGFLAFGMSAQAFAQIFHTKGYVDMIIVHLGYPLYFLNIIGVWKLLGVVAILVPGFKLVKEWAYAGFFFVMSGAVFSHLASGDHLKEIVPASVLILFIVASWYFRPESRKFISVEQ